MRDMYHMVAAVEYYRYGSQSFVLGIIIVKQPNFPITVAVIAAVMIIVGSI
jgi:hypothetical protein